MPVGRIAAAQITSRGLCEHTAHAPSLLAQMLRRVGMRQTEGHRSNAEIYCMIAPMVKLREIFQVYNN